MNLRSGIVILAIVFIGLLLCGAFNLVQAVLPKGTPAAPTTAPIVPPIPQPTSAPAAAAPAGPSGPSALATPADLVSSECLSIAQFQAMWTASSPQTGPGPLIQTLNNAFDMSGGRIGTQWPVGPFSVAPMSLVWTDLLSNQPPAASDKWVPLRLQGQWGVYAVYDNVNVPTPGRSARMCSSLDPTGDLAGWSR